MCYNVEIKNRDMEIKELLKSKEFILEIREAIKKGEFTNYGYDGENDYPYTDIDLDCSAEEVIKVIDKYV